jgi:hypothetical protein
MRVLEASRYRHRRPPSALGARGSSVGTPSSTFGKIFAKLQPPRVQWPTDFGKHTYRPSSAHPYIHGGAAHEALSAWCAKYRHGLVSREILYRHIWRDTAEFNSDFQMKRALEIARSNRSCRFPNVSDRSDAPLHRPVEHDCKRQMPASRDPGLEGFAPRRGLTDVPQGGGTAGMIAIIAGRGDEHGRPPAANWCWVLLKSASTAALFCIRFASAAALSARPKVPLTRDGHYRGGMP